MSAETLLAIVIGLALAVALDGAGLNPFCWIHEAAHVIRRRLDKTLDSYVRRRPP